MPIEGIVDQDFINQQVAATEQFAGSSGTDGEFDSNTFLRILMTQLQNQSPYDTMDSNEILQQQSMLTQVEQSVKSAEATETLTDTVSGELAGLKESIAEINVTLNTIAQQLGSDSSTESGDE